MKKAITTILSVLMLVSCLTVNVFAVENENPQNPSDQPSEETYDDVQTQTEEKSVLDNSDEQDKEKTPSATDTAVISFSRTDNGPSLQLNFTKKKVIDNNFHVWVMSDNNTQEAKQAFDKAFDDNILTDFDVKIGDNDISNLAINVGVIEKLNKFAVHGIGSLGNDTHIFLFSDLFDVVDFSRVKSVELICGEYNKTINLNNKVDYKGTIYYKPDDGLYLDNGSSYTVRVNYNEGDPEEFSYSSSLSEDDNFKVCCGAELFATGIENGRFVCFAWNFERLQNNTRGSENNNPTDNNPEENLGNIIYARKVDTPPNSSNISYSEFTEKPTNVVFVDIYNDERFGIFFGDKYNNANSDNDINLTYNDVSIIKSTGIEVTYTGGVFSIHSTHSDSTASITYNDQSLIFKSKLPDVGVYTSNKITDETYCKKYNTRREFFINWNEEIVESVSINTINNHAPESGKYTTVSNSNSIKLTITDPNIISNNLDINVSVKYKNSDNSNTYNMSCEYDSGFVENNNFIIRNDQVYFKKTHVNNDKSINFYLSKEAYYIFDLIKDKIDFTNIGSNSVLVNLLSEDNNEINQNVFFDHGAYFKKEKTISLEAYAVTDPVEGELNTKLNFTSPIDLNFKYKDTNLDYAVSNVYLFTKSNNNYQNTYRQVVPSSSGTYPFNNDCEYYWYSENNSENNGNTSYVTIHSTFNSPVFFGRRLNKSDFNGIEFKQQNATVSITDLQSKIDSQFTVPGSKLTLVNNTESDQITIENSLRITNYADDSMFYVTSNITDRSLLIDLNNNTLNLGTNRIIVSEYSTVHIANGTITGSGDTLFDNYGGLSLHNVTCKNTNTADNSYAIKTYRGTLFLDEKSRIVESKNGILLADSHYYSDLDNTCFVSGFVNVTNNGIVFEEKETKFKDTLCVLVPDYINMDIDNQYSILDTITPTVIAGNTAIIANNKSDIKLAGTSYYKETGNNQYDEYQAKTTISGGKSISLKSGQLDIDGNIDIIANVSNNPNIEIMTSGINANEKLEINIDVSQKTNFDSAGSVIQEKLSSEISTSTKDISLDIYCQEHINSSKFIYAASNPFDLKSTNVSKYITAGFYSSDISSHINSNKYKVDGPNNNLYEVKINANDPYDYEFIWDKNAQDSVNLSNLESYLTNLGTRNITIRSFDNASASSSKAITITGSKNITIEDGVSLNNIKLVVNTRKGKVHINGGTLRNNLDSCIVLENGEFFTDSKFISAKNETIKVTGGILHFDSKAYAEGPMALNVLATVNMPEVHVCGDLKGTSGTAINYSINSNLNPDYNEYSLNIVGIDKTKEHSTITGGVVVNNGKVVTMSTEISADIAFELKGNSELILDNDTVVIGNNTAVFLNGAGTLFFNKGVVEAPYPVKILEGNPRNYQVVFKDGVHCKVSSNTNDNVISFVNNNGIIQNNVNINEYNLYCEFAFFNKPVDENQFNNLNMEMNQGSSQRGKYTCVQYDVLSAEYPYCVAYKLSSVAHNSLHLNLTNNEGIDVDSSKLDLLKENQGNNEWTLLVVEEADIANKPSYMVDAYEIQVRNVTDNNDVTLLPETSGYQEITIPVQTHDINNILVSHKHGTEGAVLLEKLSAEEISNNLREGYYVKDSSSITIVTKRFSQFGIFEKSDDMLPFAPTIVSPECTPITYGQKLSDSSLMDGWHWETSNIAPTAGIHTYNAYKEVTDFESFDYSQTDGYDFNKNRIIRNIEITVNKAEPKYSIPTGLSATYGDLLYDVKLPTGWLWENTELSVGNATTTGNKFNAIFTPSDKDNYNTVSIELPVIVKKAEIDIKTLTIPTFAEAQKGDSLSKLTFTQPGWNWVNPSATVSDSNYAVYNPDKNNYVDLLVTVPVYIRETVAGKDVSISNTVSADKKLEDIKVENNNITQSVLDIIKNVKSDTVVTGDAKEFISSSGNESLTISTELVKNEVTESAKNEALEKAEVKAENVAMVLDFKINIKVTKGSETKTGTITELAEPVKLTVKLPEGSKTTAAEGKELKYYVLVIHGDDVLKIPATLNAADGTVTFSADKFSTYILVSEEVTKTVAENSTPSYVPSANKKPVVNTAAK